MFVIKSCPHCKRADVIVDELKQENPEYEQVSFEVIDENEYPDIAAEYDYYYVPCFYVDEKKIFEGVPTHDKVQAVLEAATV